MFNSKAFTRTISLGMSTVVLTGAVMLSGCAAPAGKTAEGKPEDSKPPVVQENKQDKVMPEFMALVGENSKPDVLIAYIDKNIAEVSQADASKMLQELEKAQQAYLPLLEDKYYNDGNTQESLSKVYNPGFDMTKLEGIQDAGLVKLLEETRDMGYMVETAEGTYFPIMNYEYLKKYSPYAASDMKDYIDIMSVETNKVPAKDAALVIGWDEVVERAFTQEIYISKYTDSPRLEAVKELNKKYLTFILYGLNNTPLFSYDTKKMNPKAEDAYSRAVKENEGSNLAELINKYLEVIRKSNYKLTDEVEKFRKEAIGSN